MKDNIKDCAKLWNKVGYLDSIYDIISIDNSDGNIEGFTVGTYDNARLGKFNSKMLGVVDNSKLGGECGCKETAPLGVPELSDEGITEGVIICTNLGNYEQS